MKKPIIAVSVIVAIGVALYLMGAFVAADFNTAHWDRPAKVMMCYMWVAFSVVTLMTHNLLVKD